MTLVRSLFCALAFLVFAGPAWAQVGCVPNPNLTPRENTPTGFVDGCAIPAAGLNELMGLSAAQVANYAATPIYGGGLTQTQFLLTLGNISTPNTTMNAPLIVQKTTTGAVTSTFPNSGVYFSAVKTGSTSGDRATAMIAEAYDIAGGNGTFIEGGRFHATVAANSGQADGVVCLAQDTAGIAWDFLIGCESDTENLGADVSYPPNLSHLAVGFLATNGMSGSAHTADAGFMTNPYNGKKFNIGFDVEDGSVSQAAFRSAATTSVGLDLSAATNSFAGIELANNTNIRFKGVGGSDLNVMYVPSGSNALILGTDTQGITIPSTSVPTPGAGFFSIYMDGADNKLKAKGPSGTVTILAVP